MKFSIRQIIGHIFIISVIFGILTWFNSIWPHDCRNAMISGFSKATPFPDYKFFENKQKDFRNNLISVNEYCDLQQWDSFGGFMGYLFNIFFIIGSIFLYSYLIRPVIPNNSIISS